jgi:hypothetical protein
MEVTAMRRVLWLLLCLLVLGNIPGCGGDKEKGFYENAEKPKPPPEKKS